MDSPTFDQPRRFRWAAVLLTCLGAGLCFAPVTWAQGASPESASAAQKEAATDAYREGMSAFEQNDYEGALKHFSESYGVVASPNSHLMMVRSLENLARWLDAYDEAVKLVVEADEAAKKVSKYADTAKAARTELSAVESKIGFIMVTVSGPKVGSLKAGERSVAAVDWDNPIPALPGTVEVVLTTPDGSVTKTVTVAAGQEAALTIDPPKPPGPVKATTAFDSSQDTSFDRKPDEVETTDVSPYQYAAIGSGVVGVGGMVVFGIFGVMARSSYDDLLEQCPNDHCPADLQSKADDADSQQTIANIGVAVGAVGLGAAAVLLMLSDELGKTPVKSDDDSMPELSIGPGVVSVKGSF